MYTQGRSGPYGPHKQGVPHAFLWEIYAGERSVPNCQVTNADQQRALLGLTPHMGRTSTDLESAGNANLRVWQKEGPVVEEVEEENLEREQACFASFNPQ